MNEQDIYEGIGQVDDDVLLRSEKKRRARRKTLRSKGRREYYTPRRGI